jgi:hypothetical protein
VSDIVAEYSDRKLTGVGAIERFAEEQGRVIIDLGNGTWKFIDGTFR